MPRSLGSAILPSQIMKLLLIQPPVQDFYTTDIRLQPLGLCYLKAAVMKHLPDISVMVKDYQAGWGRRTISIPRELQHLRQYYSFPDKSPFSTFYHYYHFGASFEELAEDVAGEAPDIVGISSLFSPYYREALAAAAAIKKKTGVPIILGGPHVSACPQMMLDDASVDYVIRGEGERPLVELLACLRGHGNLRAVPNLGFKENGRLVFNDLAENFDINELPEPDISDLHKENYQLEEKPLCFVLTSRGCPYRCAFCSVHTTFGRGYRQRNVESIVEEIKKRFAGAVRVFDFEDDCLGFDRGEFKTLCLMLAREFAGKDVRFTAMNGFFYHHLDEELLGLMWSAGFRALNISLVSADSGMSGAVGRALSLNKYVEVLACAHKLGFQVVSYQILGLPGDTIEGMVSTLVFCARLPVLLGASPFYLTPGTALSECFPPLSGDDIIRARLTALGIETQDFSRDDVYTLFVATRIINFLKGFSFAQASRSLDEILAEESPGERENAGKIILRRLLEERQMYGWTKEGFAKLERFKSPLFEQIWNSLNTICTVQGGIIHSLTEPLAHCQ
jgi:radical SAM superfamily enzyme YgiQ (UPF0313 family)